MAGRAVLVTGGTRGIGRALVASLLHRGDAVVLTARDVERGMRTRDELAARLWPDSNRPPAGGAS